MHGTREWVQRRDTDNLTPPLSYWHWSMIQEPTVTSVYVTHPTTVCAYVWQNKIRIRQWLFLANFWMDVTDRNIGLLMDEFWMLPMITSAHESVKGTVRQQIIFLYYTFYRKMIWTKNVDNVLRKCFCLWRFCQP